MRSNKNFTDLEQVVLLAVHRLGEKAYGVVIERYINGEGLREVTNGALSLVLNRLARYGAVTRHVTTSALGTQQRCIVYKLTETGEKSLRAAIEPIIKLSQGFLSPHTLQHWQGQEVTEPWTDPDNHCRECYKAAVRSPEGLAGGRSPAEALRGTGGAV